MATRPRSARTKRVTRSDQANRDPIVLPDLSRPPRVRRSPSMAAALALAGGSSSSAASIPAPSAASNPSTSSTLAANASTSVSTSSDLATPPPPPESTSNPPVSDSQPSVPLPVSTSQPSDPLPARPPLGKFFGPHHINRQHYERFTKMDKKLVSIGAIVENDCVAIESLIEHFRHQEWDKFIQWKGIGYPYVVKCFYANISSENYSFPIKSYFTKDIVIDIDTLSRIFNIPNSGVDVFDKTLRDFDGYIDGDTYESAVAMIFKEGENDLDSPAPQQMKLLPQCLARIISLNIAPTLSRSTIYKWTPVLIYCLLKKIKVNLPKLLIQTMYYSVQQPKQCLPFGKVLTKIFEMENIDLDAYPKLEPRSSFGKKNLGQMHYNSYSVPLTLDSVPSQVKKKDSAKASTSSQPEASVQQEEVQPEDPNLPGAGDQQEDPSSGTIPMDQPSLDVTSLSPHPETASTQSPILTDTSIPSSPPPSNSEPQAPLVATESSSIPVEPLVTQAEIPPSAPPAQNPSQPSPIDPDQPIFDDEADDNDDGPHQYSPLRDEDLPPSPPHTSPPTSSIPPPPFSIPPSAQSFCVPPRPTFYFGSDTSMSYDYRWLAYFSIECYYNTVNTMIADSNARAWETHHMLQTGFQSLNPSIRLPPPSMHSFIPVPTPSPAMRTHHLMCLQKKSETLKQMKRAAAMSSSFRPPSSSFRPPVFSPSSMRPPAPSPASVPTSSTFAQPSFTAPASSVPILTTKPIGTTSTFAPVSLSSAFASLSRGLGIRPPIPPVPLSASNIPIRASPEVALMSEIFKEKSSIDFSQFASSPMTSSLPQTSTSAAPSPPPPAPIDTPSEHPATEAPASPTPSVLIPSVDDSPEGELRFKRTKKAASHPHQPALKKKKVVASKPTLAEEVYQPPTSTSSTAPPVPIPYQVAHPTPDELCNFIMSQKKKKN